MSYVIKYFFALILFSSLDLAAEEEYNYKNSEKPYKNSELKSGS